MHANVLFSENIGKMWGETQCMWLPNSMCTFWMGKDWRICLSEFDTKSIDYCIVLLHFFNLIFVLALNFMQIICILNQITHSLVIAPFAL